MRGLIIDPEAIEKVNATVMYARHHEYNPDKLVKSVPGEDPGHVVNLNTYRCVFSFTRMKLCNGQLFRHLTISIPSENYPNPLAVAMIAGLFGFTHPERGIESRVSTGNWFIRVDEIDHCIVLAEAMEG